MDEMSKKIVEELMGHLTAKVQMFRSMHQQGPENTDHTAEFVPGEGRTVVIEVCGGANNVRVERIKTEDDED